MKKSTKGWVLGGAASGAVLVAGLAGWYVFGRTTDPMQRAAVLASRGDMRGALVDMRNAVRARPRDPDVHLSMALLLLRVSEPVAAEKELKTARALGADPWAVTPPLGEAYVAQGRWAEVLDEIPRVGPTAAVIARDALSRALAQIAQKDLYGAQTSLELVQAMTVQAGAKGRVEGPLIAALLAEAKGEPAQAEAAADEALRIDPRQLDALLLRQRLLTARHDRAGALAMADQAVTVAQWSPTARLDRATLLMAGGEDAKARFDVGAVLARFPRHPGANYLNAVLLTREKKYSEAELVFQELQPMIGTFPRIPYFQALASAGLGQAKVAMSQADQYHQRVPDDADGLLLLARTQLANKRADLAVVLLEPTGRRDASTLDLLGLAYAGEGDVQMALQTLQAAAAAAAAAMTAEDRDGAAEILAHLAMAQIGANDSPSAIRTLERSLALDPAQPAALAALVTASLNMGDLDRAEATLQRLRSTAGDTATMAVLGGSVLLARSDLDGARTAFLAALKRFPNDSAARLGLAKVLVLQGRVTQGTEQLLDILKQEPANFEALTTYLQFLLQVDGPKPESLRAALEALRRARAAAPTNSILTAMESDLLVRSGDPKAAADLVRLARQGGNGSALLLAAQARAQAAAGLNQEAKASYQALLQAEPSNPEARYQQVGFLLRLNEVDAAKAALRRALADTPGSFPVMSALMSLEGRTGGLDGELALAAAARADPANLPDAALLKGDALMGSKLYKDAADAYRAEYAAAPSALLARRLALAAMAAGDDAPATELLRGWMAAHPGDADVAQALARLDLRAKRFDAAEENLGITLAAHPRDLVSMNNLAWIYQSKGDARARGLAQRAYLQAPDAHTADTLGWIMVRQGQAAAAVPLLRQAGGKPGSDPALTYHLAVALRDAGKPEEAVPLLQAVVAAPGEFDGKADARTLLGQLAGAPR